LQKYNPLILFTHFNYGVFNNGDITVIPNNDHVFKYLNNLKHLKNLEELYILYDIHDNNCITNCTRHYLSSIETVTLKNLKNLKLLDIHGINLSQENVDEISTMENLDSLQLDLCSFENVKTFHH